MGRLGRLSNNRNLLFGTQIGEIVHPARRNTA
jgi:hypothetical protein